MTDGQRLRYESGKWVLTVGWNRPGYVWLEVDMADTPRPSCGMEVPEQVLLALLSSLEALR